VTDPEPTNIPDRDDLPGPPEHAHSFDAGIPLPSIPGNEDWKIEEE